MSKSVQEALEARKSRKKNTEQSDWQAKSDKVSAALKARDNRKKSNIQSTKADLQDRINKEIEAIKTVSTPSWGKDSLKDTLNATRERTINIENLKREVEANRKYLGDKEADNALSILKQLDEGYTSHLKFAEGRSQFETEDEYNSYVKEMEEYEKKKTFDITAGQEELDFLKSLQEEAKKISASATYRGSATTPEGGALPTYDYGRGGVDSGVDNGYQTQAPKITYTKEEQKRLDEIDRILKEKGYGGLDTLDDIVTEKTVYYNQSKRIQDSMALSSVVNNPDFGEYSGYVSTKADKSQLGFIDKLKLDYGDYHDATYEYINNQAIVNGDSYRSAYEKNYATMQMDNPLSDGESMYTEKNYALMTEDEIAVYNYWYAKEGEEKAKEYLESIQETLNMRKATQTFSNLEDNTFLEMLFGIEAGLDQFSTGIENLFTDKDYYAPTDEQIVSGKVREDLEDVGFKILGNSLGQGVYDLITTTANQLPTILVGTIPYIGQVAGAGLLGASAAGNAKAEMINLGYSKEQANSYARMIFASEAGLQYLLGGIGALGGKLSGGMVSKVLSKVDNAFARVAIKWGGSMLSEGFEEGLQTILEPWFKSLATGVDFEAPNIDEVLYSGLLGALSAGFLEGPSIVAGEVKTYKQGMRLKESGTESVDRLVKLGTTFSADTVAYQLAGKVNENTGAYTIGRLLNEVGASLSEKNRSDIEIALISEGMTSDDAKTISKWLNKAVDGGYFNKRQVQALENNEIISKVFYDVIVGENSTVNQRITGYNELYNLAMKQSEAQEVESKEASSSPTAMLSNEEIARRISKATGRDAYEMAQEFAQQAKTDSVTDTNVGDKSAENGALKPSNIKEIVSIKDGEIMLRLDDGEVVNSKNVEYSSDGEALLYENIVDMGLNAVTANAFVKGYDPSEGLSVDDYAKGFREAYKYGKYNFPEAEMSRDGFSALLSEEKKSLAYNLGKTDAKYDVSKMQEAVRNAKVSYRVDKGTMTIEQALSREGLTHRQKSSLKGLKALTDSLGIKIRIFESKVGEDGKRIGENGRYDPSTGIIYIDLYAGLKGEGTILFTAAHELTHFIREWSPAKFKVFADFLIEQYGKKGVSVDALVRNQIAKAKRNGRDISYDTAYEEVVADSCEAMLADGDAISKIAELKAKDKSLWQKIKSFITNLVAKIRKVYEGLKPDSIEGRYVAEMLDVAEQLKTLWSEALVDASDTYSATSAEEGAVSEGEKKLSERDSQGNELSKEQQEFFKDSKVRDEDGNLLVVYHGTNAKFNVFEQGKKNGWLGKGIYFTESKSYAKENGKNIIKAYLNAKNPFIAESNDHYGVFSELKDRYPQIDVFNISEVLRKEGFDGIEYTDWDKGRIIVVYKSEQIKLTSNKKPTSDPDIRYSFRDSESGTANDSLTQYDEELTRFITQRGDYIVDSFEKLKEIVNTAFDNPKLKATAYFGIINAETLDKIKNSISNLPKAVEEILFKEGRDYSIATTLDTIRHIVDEKSLDKDDAVNYLDRLADTILEFDSVKFNYYIKGKDKLPGLLFKKKFSDGTMVSFDFVSHKKRSIVLQTLYMDSADYQKKKSAETLLMQNAHSNTSETQVGQTSDNSIPQSPNYVKRKLSDRDSYAPTFYSHMGKVIDGIRLEKMGANGVVSYLKGKGVKDEEIKWSGIETFLEGKKSVTKAELQEFVAGSQLQIEEEMSGYNQEAYDELEALWVKHAGVSLSETFSDDFDLPLTEDNMADVFDDMEREGYDVPPIDIQRHMLDLAKKAGNEGRWARYKLGGGKNYRELVFKMPKSSYSNDAMKAHWGQDAEGVLAHARIQDMTTSDGKNMLFIEEIQSDWHNEGAKDGYQDAETESKIKRLREEADIAFYELEDYSTELTGNAGEYKSVAKTQKGRELLRNHYKTRDALKDAENAYVKKVPDAPFRNNYHEYVLKRLLRMAAEEGYDSIGWTTADIQSERWSEEYAEGYRIEYDQDIPKFLRKYGKKWGTTVDKTNLQGVEAKETFYDVNREEMFDSEQEWKRRVIDELVKEGLSRREANSTKFIREGGMVEAYYNGKMCDYARITTVSGTVWSMDIPDSMKDSVLNEGQVLYSDRDDFNQLKDNLKNTYKVDPQKVITLADSYMENYGGTLNKTQFRNEFLSIAEVLAEVSKTGSTEALNKADKMLAELAKEIASEPKVTGGVASEIKAIRKHLKGIRIQIPKYNKGDFDSLGGFENFRKKHMGSFILANKGINVDGLYMELQELFGVGYFPADIVNIADQLIRIAEVVDTPLSSTIEANYDIDEAKEYIASDLSEKIIEVITQQDSGKYINYRDTESVSNRSLLAGALESVAQNDVERNKLKEYKGKIALIESEQAKLSEIRAKIKELSFAKGKRDAETIKSLQFEANQSANRINTYDRQLLNLESTKALKGVLEREKQMAYKKAEQRGKDALAAYKEKASATQRELLTRAQESRKKGIENRHKTEMRHKIKKVVSELNHLLLHGSKDKNVKLGLQQAVASALDAINMDTVGADARIEKYNNLIAKATDPDVIASLTASRDRIQAQGDSLGDKLKALKDAYYDIQHGEEGKNYPTYFKEEASLIEQRIQSVIKEVGNTSLRDMSLKQLSDVYDMYKMVLTTIRNANSVWKEGKAEDLQQNASAVMAELEKLKKLKGEGTRFGELVRSYSWNEMTPYYAFDRIGSKTFMSFFMETIKGQNTYANDVAEAKAFADRVREKYGYKKWNLDKVFEFKLKDGRTFEVTLKHMLSIYAYSKREQALPHMSTGGFFFNDKSTFRKKGGILELIKRDDEGYKIDTEILAEIKGAMTKEQLIYVDEMQEYLTKMGEKGNEVTRVLWGIDIFKEKVYFPLKSKDDFIKRSTETAQSVSLKNDGMTKETVPGASNPIVLEAFDDVWASHIDRMSQYHAFVIPIDNLNKIHQYGTWSGTASMSVSTMLTGRFGSAVNEYITQFIKDLNGNVVNPGAKNPLMGFLSKFKKTAVGASLSTVVQQPTAILRAMAVIDGKYFVGKPNLSKLSSKWAELKKYAPIAIIKDIGGFDAGSGVQVSRWLNSDALTGIDKVMNTIDDISMKGAEVADQIGWTTIWEAVKREVKATTNLEGEALLKKAGERFTEVIVKTQVYDSTLSRSGFMRSKSDLMKMLTSFMGEPTLSINMMFNAVVNVLRGGSKAKAVRTIGYTYASIIAASAMASLIYALRDDDEDESYLEKYLQSMGGELISDVALAPVTSLPAVKDIVSIFQGWDVERTDVAIFKDIKDAFDGLDSENKSTYRKMEDLAGAFASAFGVPLKNLLRTGREIYNAFDFATDGITGGDLGGAFVEGVTGDKKSNTDRLYDAILSGDQNQINRVKGRFKDESAIKSAMRQGLRDNDSRIKEAAQARIDGDIAEYTRIAKEIIAEGNFSQDIIVGAINAEISAIKKGEGTESSTSSNSNKVTSIYDIDAYFDALIGRDEATAYAVKEDIIKTEVANGKDRDEAESNFNSRFANHLREQYEEGYLTDSEAIDMLVEYGDKSYEDAQSKVQYWEFSQRYPDYDLSESAVKSYYNEVEPSGISIEVYYDYSKQRSKCKGTDNNGDGKTDSGSVKAEVMQVIDSLPITSAQKDTLYFLNGWSRSTLYQAPWH